MQPLADPADDGAPTQHTAANAKGKKILEN